MKTVTFRLGFWLVFTLCFSCAVGWAHAEESAGVVVVQEKSSPVELGSLSGPELETQFDQEKYNFSNLPEYEREQLRQEVDIEESLGEGDNNSNQLIYDFRAKQEDIRLYEVILLAVMSLCALAIVLKYMKDSKTCQARDMLNGTGLVLVIFSTVLVIIIADVEIQLTAAMGVLGGIAGYLFGTLRSSQPNTDAKKSAGQAAEEKSG